MQVQENDPLQTPGLGQSLQPKTGDQMQGVPAEDLTGGWNKWINKPNNRAALMQFGIAMLQPMGFGETGLGHLASSVGSAGEAHQNVTKEAQQAEKSSTEAELRESRARAAETTSNAAELRALQTGENQRLRAENQGTTTLARQLQAQAQARRAYDEYVHKTNQDNLIADKPASILDYPTWLKSGGGAAAESASELGTGTTPSATAPTGRGYSVQEIITNPKMVGRVQTIRAMVASGDPAQMQRARDALREIEPYVNPAERTKLYSILGVH
jgi:hypothetical protein